MEARWTLRIKMRTKSSRRSGIVSGLPTGEPHRDVGDHAQVAPQIVRGLLPHGTAFLLERPELFERAFQILDVPCGLLLLQCKILVYARLDAGAYMECPDFPSASHSVERAGCFLCIAI